jgi:hypothetical protein
MIGAKFVQEVNAVALAVEKLHPEVNSVIETRSVHSADVPVRANSELVGWAEFEVVGSRLAIRMTELA